MHWYGGSIAEAVTLSKQKNAIFVVFVEDDNAMSLEMAATIDDPAVISRLSDQTNFLAVKLKSGTANYTHFAQIYQFVPVPSLFFIGRNGTPLEVVCAGVQASHLASRIDKLLTEHHGEKLTMAQPSTSSTSSARDATVDLLQSEAKASDKQTDIKPTPAVAPSPPKIPKPSDATKPEDYDIVCDGDVCVRRPKTAEQPSTSQSVVKPAHVVTETATTLPAAPENAAAPANPAAPVLTPTAPQTIEPSTSESSVASADKIERAKELIEAKRREKAELEKELEKQKEIERRNLGQGAVELKRWQADQEMKQIQEERKREKMENSLARQRILEQIAQDRAERRARDLPAPAQNVPQTSSLPPSGDVGTSARLQFKLPDGTSHTANFDANDTLADVQRYVADNLKLSSSSFALWTAFLRRELTETAASLQALQLTPSAALLVLPRQNAPAGAKPHASVYVFITQLLTTFIYQPSLALFTWLRSRVFPPPAVAPRPPATLTPVTPVTPGPEPRGAPLPRRRTNIHRLPGDAANDDDNNTWNGNSTQQM